MADQKIEEARQHELFERASKVFRDLGWETQEYIQRSPGYGEFEFIVARGPSGRGIHVLCRTKVERGEEERLRTVGEWELGKHSDGYEFWVVAELVHGEINGAAQSGVRILSYPDFLREAKKLKAYGGSKPQRIKTRIVDAVETNFDQIVVSSRSLELILKERIKGLRDERPNSSEATDERDASIEHYKKLQVDLISMRKAVVNFKRQRAKEAEVVKAVKTFRDGVRAWWMKNHQSICTKGFDIGLFLSCVTLCSIAGAGGAVAVVISGALVGGKPVADVLKGMGKKLWRRSLADKEPDF